MKFWRLILALNLCAVSIHAEAIPSAEGTERAAPSTLESSINEGLRWIYLVQYDRAREIFDQAIQGHPENPVGYFYRTAADWWEIFQNYDDKSAATEAMFLKDAKLTIDLCQKQLEKTKDPKQRAEAYLYLGGAEGLMGRWLITQRQWVKAYFAGKRGYAYLSKAVTENPELYDAYLGMGIYDYFTDALSGVEALFSAILIRGDRARGIRQLQLAIEKGAHSRTEAMLFLLEIYTWEENEPDKAVPLVTALRNEYPESMAIHLMAMMVELKTKNWTNLMRESDEYLFKIEKSIRYYSPSGLLAGWYCKGIATLHGVKDLAASETLFQKVIEKGKPDSRWVTFAYLRLGQVYDLRGDRKAAKQAYQTVLSRPTIWGSHKEAKWYLKNPFSFDKTIEAGPRAS